MKSVIIYNIVRRITGYDKTVIVNKMVRDVVPFKRRREVLDQLMNYSRRICAMELVDGM
jgi:hypothetical protein